MKISAISKEPEHDLFPGPAPAAVQEMANRCTRCGLCRKDCDFLQRYGLPGDIAAGHEGDDRQAGRAASFACSLCGLCTAVCPEGLDPACMFLDLRREAFKTGNGDLLEHSRVLNYEKRGTSKRYTWYALPEGCDTVFFPGCTLTGTRPAATLRLYEYLQAGDAAMGIVLDCCTKPSHDLGRQEYFEAMFSELCRYLISAGVKRVLVACPNCHKVFSRYGEGIQVLTVYEHLAAAGCIPEKTANATVTIHDPCVIRAETGIHTAVRSLILSCGLTIREMEHTKEQTLCCGEGGAVGYVDKSLSRQWGRRRRKEAEGNRILTYCAGCADMLGRVAPTDHLVDILFDPDRTLADRARVSKAPFTNLNRLRLKKRLQRQAGRAQTRERTFSVSPAGNGKKSWVQLLLFLTVLAAVIGIRLTGITGNPDPEKLRALIQSWGLLGPLFFMLIYTLAPCLFLPGLPLTLAGGILFGPVWGVVYTIIGATAGACLAFLVSRYLAGSWISAKLTGPRWRSLHQNVETHGWKIVAFTRLIPLFPFNLLNYAFGLTRIKFLHYAVTTALCMLPACIAFIVFSSSLLDLFKGRISREFTIGLMLILLVSLAPLFYRKYQQKKAGREQAGR